MTMKRMLAVVAIGLGVLLGVSGCPDDINPNQVCQPNSTRDDKDRPDRVWVCNEDGTHEKPVDAPPGYRSGGSGGR